MTQVSGDLLGCKFSFEMQTLPLLLWNYVHFNGSSLFWLFVSMPPCQERVTLLIQWSNGNPPWSAIEWNSEKDAEKGKMANDHIWYFMVARSLTNHISNSRNKLTLFVSIWNWRVGTSDWYVARSVSCSLCLSVCPYVIKRSLFYVHYIGLSTWQLKGKIQLNWWIIYKCSAFSGVNSLNSFQSLTIRQKLKCDERKVRAAIMWFIRESRLLFIIHKRVCPR